MTERQMIFEVILRAFRRLARGWLLVAVVGSGAAEPPASTTRPTPSASAAGDVQGMFYRDAGWLRFVVREGQPASARAQAAVRLRQADGTDIAVDFDTGQPLGPWSAFADGARVTRSDGKRAFVSECALLCVDALVHPGAVDGRPVRLDPHSIDLEYEGQPIRLNEYVAGPDPRAAGGYAAVRAVAPDGSVLWDKAYLIDARGPLFSPRDEEVGRDLVETASEIGFIRPGDDAAYLMHVAATSLSFGSVLLRIDLRTGEPTGSDPRIRAVDACLLHDVLQQAANEAMRHDRLRNGTLFASMAQVADDRFPWAGDQAVDVPARFDWALRARFFSSH